MAIQYLVPCSCGRKTAVETRQAGESVPCGCGLSLEIPRLLELKKLEKAAAPAGDARRPAVWGIGQSLVLSGAVVLAVVALLSLLVLRFTTGDPYSQTPDQIRAQFQNMPAMQTWQMWLYLKQNGVNPPKDPVERELVGEYGRRQMWLICLGIAAGGGLAIMAAGIFITRRKRTMRSGPTTG